MTPFGKVLLRACDNPFELVVVAIIILSAVPVVFGPHSSRGDEHVALRRTQQGFQFPNKLLRKIPHHRGASMQAYHITSIYSYSTTFTAVLLYHTWYSGPGICCSQLRSCPYV